MKYRVKNNCRLSNCAQHKSCNFWNHAAFMLRIASTVVSVMIASILLTDISLAEYEDKGVGARPLAMGSTFFTLADDVHSLFWNPAGLANIDNRQIAAGSGKLYGLSDLSHDFAAFGQPLKGWSNLGVSYERFGGPLYEESTAALALAYRMSKEVSAGLNLKMFSTTISNTPSRGGHGVDMGILADLGRYARFGLTVVNAAAYNDGSDPFRVYKLGVSSQVDGRLTIMAGVSRTESNTRAYETSFHVGQEFKIGEAFDLRAGWDSKPATLSAGFGFRVKNWSVDYCYRSHPVLPVTHLVTMGIGLGRSYKKSGGNE